MARRSETLGVFDNADAGTYKHLVLTAAGPSVIRFPFLPPLSFLFSIDRLVISWNTSSLPTHTPLYPFFTCFSDLDPFPCPACPALLFPSDTLSILDEPLQAPITLGLPFRTNVRTIDALDI